MAFDILLKVLPLATDPPQTAMPYAETTKPFFKLKNYRSSSPLTHSSKYGIANA
ncbi:MAG: hypothetical protein HOP34_01265 [Methylococcaceae bacterium]|nr:hypothetical protein [Methylococcaceae bacterium]